MNYSLMVEERGKYPAFPFKLFFSAYRTKTCDRAIGGLDGKGGEETGLMSRIWEIKGGTYTKTLAKIQVRGIFRIRDIRRNVLPKLMKICMETPCWCSAG